MGVSGGAPDGRAKVRHLVTRTGVAGVSLLVAAMLAASGCASGTRHAGASNCSGKQAAAGLFWKYHLGDGRDEQRINHAGQNRKRKE